MSVVMAVTTQPCMLCGKTSVVEVDPDRYARWLGGTFIQDVWPEWTPEQRELLITGTHPECWDANFDDEDKPEYRLADDPVLAPPSFDSIDPYGNDPYEMEG